MIRPGIYRVRGAKLGYSRISDTFARDGDLTTRARSVGLYMLSHREGYVMQQESVARHLKISRNTVRGAFEDLAAGGYMRSGLVREGQRVVGTWYAFRDEPLTDAGWEVELEDNPFFQEDARRTELRREEAEDDGGERVYLIGSPASTVVKIGRSCNVTRRLRAIQHMSPLSLAVLWTAPGGEALETRLHRAFAAQRQHGEWFNFQQDDPLKEITRVLGGAR